MKKTSHYRRAIWMDSVNDTLSDVIEARIVDIDENIQTVFQTSGDFSCMLARRSIHGNVRFLHFVTYEEGAPVAIINTQIQDGAADADEQDPEGENEYILSQLFCLISGNNIIWVTHNDALRDGKIQNVLASFLGSDGSGAQHDAFQFQVVLDQQVVEQAFADGIEEIDLGIGAFAPTLDRVANGGEIPAEGILASLASIFRSPATATQLAAAADIEGKLILRPGRSWEIPRVRELLTSMASSIHANYEDEFVIVTKSGLRLTRDKMSLKRVCEVHGNRRVLNSQELERHMRIILTNMRDTGIVDE
ncbi:MAG: hypothetical protein JKY99_02305 [Rhizobiales bacterium]|nr:hypothetical protein [Hyphomicrobiales bacterium]PHQ72417.1 MAG: hypothetical protein COB93_00300 [Sneathiella sp.]